MVLLSMTVTTSEVKPLCTVHCVGDSANGGISVGDTCERHAR
jgi:hypothetical protein